MPPEDPDLTLGQLRRTCRGATLLMQHLGYDPVVLAAFDTWCTDRGITRERFQRVWNETETAENAAQLLLATRIDPGGARAAIERVVRDELGSPLPWLPSALLATFQLWVVCGVTRQPRRIPSLYPDGVAEATLPPGRGPRKEFARDVEWYYRARLKQSPAPPAQLLREWKLQHPDVTSEESLVTQAIDRVHTWLNVPIQFSWDAPTSS